MVTTHCKNRRKKRVTSHKRIEMKKKLTLVKLWWRDEVVEHAETVDIIKMTVVILLRILQAEDDRYA
jgi:hypothetical protein